MFSDKSDDDLSQVSWNGAIAERIRTVDSRSLLVVILALMGAYCALRGFHQHEHELFAVGLAGFFMARGVARARPLLTRHVVLAAAFVIGARLLYLNGHLTLAMVATVCAGASLVLPVPPPPAATRGERRHIWALVDGTANDTLAPFAMRTDKSYVFSPDGLAAVAYRVRFGTAAASADPVGDPASRDAAIEEFITAADRNGWRPAVLACGESHLQLLRRHRLRGFSIGRDVVINVPAFSLQGRRFRNLRQAVQRTHNAGVTTEVYAEASLTDSEREEFEAVVRQAR